MATWDSTYEANPENSDDISAGAGEIRSTRAETRDRGEVEHDWGTVTGGYTDTGRHTQGSGRAFYGATAPANLLKPDDTSQGVALDTKDAGKVWIDTSGVSNRVHYWSGTAWVGTTPAWNGFINGQFKVNQRTAFATAETAGTSKTYWFDRWYTIHTTAAGTINRETSSLPTGAVSNVGAKVIGGTTSSAVRIGQRIESHRCVALGAGRATSIMVTVSGKVRNTGTNAITADLVVVAANAADDFSATTAVVTSASEVSALAAGSSVTFSHTFDIGSAIASDRCKNGMDIYLITTAPVAFNTGESFVVTDMVCEIGSAATKPWPEDFAEQHTLCRRYYAKTFNYSVKPAQNVGVLTGTVVGNGNDVNGNSCGIAWPHGLMRGTTAPTTYNPTAAATSATNSLGGDAALQTSNGGTTHSYANFNTGPVGTSKTAFYVHMTKDDEL